VLTSETAKTKADWQMQKIAPYLGMLLCGMADFFKELEGKYNKPELL
jgi:hypothetical protein